MTLEPDTDGINPSARWGRGETTYIVASGRPGCLRLNPGCRFATLDDMPQKTDAVAG